MTQEHALNWFEISVTDFDRAKKFYESLYDYTMPEIPMPGLRMGILLHEQGKGVGGAIVQSENHRPVMGGTIVYLSAGDDLSTILDKVEGAGGKVLLPKTDIGDNMGYFAHFADTEGNIIGLHSMN